MSLNNNNNNQTKNQPANQPTNQPANLLLSVDGISCYQLPVLAFTDLFAQCVIIRKFRPLARNVKRITNWENRNLDKHMNLIMHVCIRQCSKGAASEM